jgi:hypothetical protein
MTDNDRRISDIVDKLESLSLETTALTRELRELKAPNDTNNNTVTNPNPSYPHNFVIGNRVIIRNGYLVGKRGTIGAVTDTTKTRITLRDDTGNWQTRKYTNIGIVR